MGDDLRSIVAPLVDLGPVTQPVEQGLPVDLQVEHRVQRTLELGEQGVECLRLRNGPWEAVEDEATMGVRLRQAMTDDIDHQAVGDQLAAVEIGLDLPPQRSAGLDRRPQDVAGGDLRNPVGRRQPGGLGPLARSWRPEQDDVRGHASMMRSSSAGLLAGVTDGLVVGAGRCFLADVSIVGHLGEHVELAGSRRTWVAIQVVKRRRLG